MTPEVEGRLRAYAAGLDAEMALLRQLQRQSALQREASQRGDYEELRQATDERDRLMAALVRIEAEIKPLRHAIAESLEDASRHEMFAETAALHRAAGALVSTIISCDEETRAALLDAENARRFAVQTLEAGEQTLAAYRRVIAPSWHLPSLVNRRG